MMKRFLLPVFLLCTFVSHAQLQVSPSPTVANLIASFKGAGINISNVLISGSPNAYGTFSNGNTTNLGIDKGILLTTGSATNAIGPNNSGSLATCNGLSGGDPDLLAIQPNATEDGVVLEFDFIPQTNKVNLSFVFASEEYPEFVGASYNDAFGFFLSGPGPACQAGYYSHTNIATLPDNVTPVSIDNVNGGNNASYYVNNIGGATIQYDGFTKKITRVINVCPCQTYHVKIAIADGGDCFYDSGVFIELLEASNPLTANVNVSAGCTANTGQASATASGGIGTITYNWSPAPGTGQGTATVTGLTSGTQYTLTVDDGGSCTTPVIKTFTVPATLSLSSGASTQLNLTCPGGTTGVASVVASGGTGPYTYSWSPSGGSGATASGLAAGTYTVTVKDAALCTATKSFTVVSPPAFVITPAQTNVSCYAGTNGSASVTVSGGTGPYTYAWSSGGTGNVENGLAYGNYTVTITDDNSCSATQSFSITQPAAALTTVTTGKTDVSCNGGTDGTASVTVGGGTAPYTYAWSPSGGAGPTASGLADGTYTVTIKDANNCAITSGFTITEPPVLAATQSQVNVSCNGGTNGVAAVVVSGGTAPYTYTWSPSGGAGASATGLAQGAYSVLIKDSKNCALSKNFTITEPAVLSATTSQTDVSCNGGANGTATVVVSGGTAPYTYAWFPSGGAGATATGLSNGAYAVTITDNKGCSISKNFTINQPATTLSATTSQTDVSCNGGSNGIASVVVSGGNAPYTYAWSPAGGTAATATGLSARAYTVTITDNSSCVLTKNFTITEPSALSATTNQTNVSCNGGSNGTASVVVSGGTAPYTYAWSPSGGIAATATGLSARAYAVTIRDNHNCVLTENFTITEPTALAATKSQVNISCNGGSNGSATVVAGGGTAPYTYQWSPSGGTGATISGVGSGVYSVTITDSKSCTSTESFTITEPAPLTATTNQVDVGCNGGSNGSASVTASGGTAPYTYAWSPSGGTGATASGLNAGAYSVTITDNKGCSIVKNVVVNQASTLSATTSQADVSCSGGSNGTASVMVSGGTAPYTYAWSPSGGTSATASGLSAGNYSVTITDNHSCSVTKNFTIAESAALALTTTTTGVTCDNGTNGTAGVTASGGNGNYSYSWNPSVSTTAVATGLTAGNYTVTVTDANGCSGTKNIVVPVAVSSPATPVAGVTQQPDCIVRTGSVVVTSPSGAGLAFSLDNNTYQAGSLFNGVTAGTYNVSVRNASGCITTGATVTVNNPPPLPAAPVVTIVQPGCSATTGSITVSGAGLLYSIDGVNFNSNNYFSNLAPNIYTVYVKNSAGCISQATATILPQLSSPPTPVITAAGPTSFCSGGNVLLTTTTATNPQWYVGNTLIGGANTTAYTVTAAGDYSVVSTNASGCSTRSSTITVTTNPTPAKPVITASGPLGFCDGGSVLLSAPVAPAYKWSDNSTGQQLQVKTAGNFSVAVTNSFGCWSPVSDVAAVSVYANPVFTVTSDKGTTLSRGTSTVLSTGTTGMTVVWSPATGINFPFAANPVARPLTTITYTATVTSSQGCSASRDITLTVLNDYKIVPKTIITPNGDGINDRFVIENIDAYPDNAVQIFDRVGKKVYEKKNYNNDWDGKVKDRPFMNDTYFYIIMIEGKIVKKGSVTIVL